MTEQYVFTPNADQGFVPLSRSKTGRLVRKQILKTGTLNYPGVKGGKVEIDNAFLSNLVDNFDSKVCDIVQFPLADNNNAHSEDPLRNGGEVVQLKHEGDALYAYIDVRKDEVVQGISDKTIIGASAMLALDYTDTRTGKKAGPTLLHVAATNRPHVLELEDFEVIAASVDSTGEAVLLTATTDNEENTPMTTKDEAFEYLKSEHDIDVAALLERSGDTDATAALSALAEKLGGSGVIKLSNGEDFKADDIVLGVGQLVDDNAALSSRVDALELSGRTAAAEAEVDKLITDGFLPEAKREAYVSLRLSNEETFKALVPEQPVIKLSGEPAGFVPADESHDDIVSAEIKRYSEMTA